MFLTVNWAKPVLIILLLVLFLPGQSVAQNTIVLTQTEADATVGLDRKAFGGPYSQGYHHDFNLGTSVNPCERIVSINIDIAISNYTPNIPPGCAHTGTFYNTYYGCAPYSGVGGSCPLANVIDEIPFPNAGAPFNTTYSCTAHDFQFGGNFSADIVPVFTTGCTNGQDAINQGYVAFTYTITVTIETDLITCTGSGCLAGMTTVQFCDDGDPCTENDVETVLDCDGSICVPCMGTPISSCTNTVALPCDDGDPCTINDMELVDDCNNTIICTPCQGTPDPASCDPACTTVQPCDDGNPCTINDMETISASGAVCVPCMGTPSGSSCDPACTTTQLCDDGNPCTNNDMETVAADGSICVPCAGTVDSDSCDPACTTTQACNDGNPCTNNDEETIASDGSVCVPCAGTLDPASCDPACTTTQACNDGNACTNNDQETIASDGSI